MIKFDINIKVNQKPLKPIIIKGLMLHVFVVLLSLTSIDTAKAQILLAGTTFEPKPGLEGQAFVGITEVQQYGFQTGNLNVNGAFGLPATLGANVFNGSPHYAITNNPNVLDNTRYVDLATPDHQLVMSSAASTPHNLLTYSLIGLRPGSPVEVRVTYCNVISPTYTTCGPGEILSLRGVVNPDQYNTTNGQEFTPQLKAGECNSVVWTEATTNSQVVGADGTMNFYLNNMQIGPCKAVGIKSIEIWGTPKPEVFSAQGASVCAGEQITLQTKMNYNGSYQWQVNTGSGWTNAPTGTNKSLLYEVATVRNYEFRVVITPSGGGAPITSDPISVDAITCCEINGAPASRQTVYYDNFGRVDIASGGTKYYVWDYSNVLNPVEVERTTSTPFRWTVTPPPLGAAFEGVSGEPPIDGEYVVASYITGYSDYNGIVGSRMAWAGNVTGQTTAPQISYDHSGTLEGGGSVY